MRVALIALAVVLGLVAVLVGTLPWLAEPVLRAGLRLAAPANADFERLRLGWGDLELEGITIGQADQELARLRAVYRLPELLEGRLERVEIEGLVVRASWRDGRLHLAGIETTDEAGETGVPPLPDVEEVVLREARFELSTDLGTLQLPLSAQIRQVGDRLSFKATIEHASLSGIEGTIRADLALDGDLPRGAPITIDGAQARGTVTVVAENAALGIARGIDGEARLGFDLAQRQLQVETSGFALTLADMGSAPDLALSGISLLQRLHWSYTSDRLTLDAPEPGTLDIDSVAAPDLRAGPLSLRLEPTDRPLLEVAFDDGAPAAWRQSMSAAIEALDLQLGAMPLRVQSQVGTVTLAAQGAPSLNHAEIGLVGGEIRLPEHALALEGIGARVGLTSAGPALDQKIPITVERISHGGRPAWFAPLALRGELRPGAEGVAFKGDLTRIGSGLALAAQGEARPSGAVRAKVELAPIVFGPGLQPKDLAPIVDALVGQVEGQLALNGDLTWNDAGLAGDLAILVDQLGLTVGPARLTQINGVVQLDRLWPPTTPPAQQLAIGLLDLGLPLTAGIASFQLVPGPRVEVGQLEWRLAGGTARAEPFSLGSRLEGANVTLRAEQLDLGQLLALTRLDGLTGEGSLDGVLPVRLAEGAAIIEHGELATTEPGVLRYDAGAAPAALQHGGEGVDLLLQALENFHYETLRITLDGRTDATMDIGLHLGGANPDLYDGHPIEFNLDLEGELANILRQGIASYQIPDRVRERMQGFAR